MKFKLFLPFFLHSLIILFLTVISQIGGIIYLFVLLIISSKKSKYRIKRIFLFSFLYLFSTYILIPKIALIFDREKISTNKNLTSHFFLTNILNRNYVKPELNLILNDVSKVFKSSNNNLKVVYLDANFPFFNGFPLLPHLSHNDGKKIDIAFIYEDKTGKTTNFKPSVSGYGVFENPKLNEKNQTEFCKKNGYWHYDFTKYLTLGNRNKELKLSENLTKLLIFEILKHKEVSKLFIEPHLKTRLNLHNQKIRFHGCGAVRHDDHIHFQIN